MKNIKSKLRSVMILMLALAMLFGIGATAVSAMDTGKENVETTTDVSNTGNVENLTGWFDITSGPDGIKITLTPDKAALKGISKEQIKALATDLVDAIKELVKEDVVGGILGDVSITDEKAFETIFDNYIKNEYGESVSKLAFFQKIVKNENGERETFIKYVCDTLLANAIKFGVVTVDDVPTAEEIEKTIDVYIDNAVETEIKSITENLDDYIDEFVKDTKDEYLKYLLGDDNVKVNEDVKAIVNGKIPEYVKELFSKYLEGKFALSTATVFEKFVNAYFDIELFENIEKYLKTGTTGDNDLDKLIFDSLGTYVKNHFMAGGHDKYVADYIAYVRATDKSSWDEDTQKLYDTFTKDINDNIAAWLEEYLANKIEGTAIGKGNLLAGVLDGKYDEAYIAE